jgi:hypothetical protein
MADHAHSEDARRLIADIDRVRRRTRAGVGGAWFPLILFGSLMLAGTAVGGAFGGPAVAVFWTVAGPVGGAVTAVFFARRGRRAGLERPPVPLLVVTVLIMVGAFATGALGGALGWPRFAAAGPAFAISIGYALFARLAGHAPTGLLAGALASLTAVLLLAGVAPNVLQVVLGCAYGGSFVALGLADAVHMTPIQASPAAR